MSGNDIIQKIHFADCFRFHPKCAVAEVERLREQVRVAREALGTIEIAPMPGDCDTVRWMADTARAALTQLEANDEPV